VDHSGHVRRLAVCARAGGARCRSGELNPVNGGTLELERERSAALEQHRAAWRCRSGGVEPHGHGRHASGACRADVVLTDRLELALAVDEVLDWVREC